MWTDRLRSRVLAGLILSGLAVQAAGVRTAAGLGMAATDDPANPPQDQASGEGAPAEAESPEASPDSTVSPPNEPAAPEAAAPAGKSENPPPQPQPSAPALDDDEPTDADLLERIDPSRRSPLDEAREKLDQAIASMRTAKDRLAGSDTGDQTRALQSRAADDLEKILDLLQQPPPQSQKNQQQNQDSQKNQQQSQNQQQNQQSQSRRQRQQQGRRNQSRQRRQSQSRKQRGPQQQQMPQQAQQQPQPEPGESADRASESDDRADPAKRKAEEEARRRAVANDVWGHLPPNVREALQKSFNERYLPKYEDLVRRYYESLAEQNRDRP